MECYCPICIVKYIKGKEDLNKQFFKLIENLDAQQIADFVLSTYQIEINTKRIKWCITYAKNRNAFIYFFIGLQNHIKNQKFPYPENPHNLKFNQLDKQSKAMIQLNKEHSHYPETLIKDFCNNFNWPKEFILE